jgi:hypothetical protein
MSESFFLAATSRTPQVSFDITSHSALIEGECYPEDADKFFTVLNQAIDDYFVSGTTKLNLQIKLIYFNSSSARALMEMMDALEGRASAGIGIEVNWFYDEDDDVTQEFIEDVISDYGNLKISVTPSAS